MKMKKIISLMLVVLMMLSVGLPVGATNESEYLSEATLYLAELPADALYKDSTVVEIAEKMELSAAYAEQYAQFVELAPPERQRSADISDVPFLSDIVPHLSVSSDVGPVSFENSMSTRSTGNAPAYHSETSSRINCYAYSIGFNFWATPGQVGYLNGSPFDRYTTVNELATYVEADVLKAWYSDARVISSNSAYINSGERRIAMRVGKFEFIEGGQLATISDFHFMHELSNGAWAGKSGKNPSKNLGYINPTYTSNWELASTNQYYNSATVFMAV